MITPYTNSRYLVRDASNPRLQVLWIIDREGFFRQIERIQVHRAFLRKLAWLWDFTLAESEIEPGKQLPVGELLIRIESAKSPPGFPTAGQLKGYLRKQPPDRIFDTVMFREFWDKVGPPLKPHEWEESI
jgi:hypothetical protein